MKNLAFIFLISPLLINAQGLNWSTSEEVESSLIAIPTDYGYVKSTLPSNHNMLQYAPPVEYQSGGTCVGFAAGYTAHSTMLNKALGITNPFQKEILAMDPYFIYSLNNGVTLDPCEEGLTFTEFFNALEKMGNMRDLYPPETDCGFDWVDFKGDLKDELIETLTAAFPFRIDDYGRIDLENPDWLENSKYYLANDIPIIIGAYIDDDFEKLSSDKYGVWNYRGDVSTTLGGHAMCILGYDDYKYGGSFLVRNSWGYSFGIEGNLWIKYSDFRKIVGEAWVILPDESLENYYTTAEYSFNIKSTLFDGLEYRLDKADNGDIYEGFYSRGNQVWAFHIMSDGSIYFGQFIDYVKHGVGFYCASNGDLYETKFYDGELVSGEELGYSSNESKLVREFLNTVEVTGESQLFEGDVPAFPIE